VSHPNEKEISPPSTLRIGVRMDQKLTTKCWVGFIDWLDRNSCISPSVGGDKKRGTTNHSPLGLPTASHAAQNIVFFQPFASLSVVKREPQTNSQPQWNRSCLRAMTFCPQLWQREGLILRGSARDHK
jgi:hypothetical protein